MLFNLPRSPLDILKNAVDMLPNGLPFSSVFKNITRALASDSQGNATVLIYCLSDSGRTFRGLLDQGQLRQMCTH